MFFVVAKGDSTATGHYFCPRDVGVLHKVRRERGPSVSLPNNDVIEATHTAQLPTPYPLPPAATKTAIFLDLSSASLVSLPQLFDHGCEVLLTPTSLHVIKGGNFILDPNTGGHQVLYGIRNPHDGLWDIPLPQAPAVFQSSSSSASPLPPLSSSSSSSTSSVAFPPSATSPKKTNKPVNPFHVNHVNLPTLDSVIKSFQQQDQNIAQSITSTTASSSNSSSIHSSPVPSSLKLNLILRKRQLKKDLAKFLHQALFSPRSSTLKKAIKLGFLHSFPGLTEHLVDKYLEPSVATESGHLRQENNIYNPLQAS